MSFFGSKLEYMKRIIILLLLQSITAISIAQTSGFTQTIRGRVIDEQSGNILSGVTVSTYGLSNNIVSIADSLGYFILKQVPIGRESVRASMTGYEESVLQNIEVTSSKEVVLEIKLKEKVKRLNDVVLVSNSKKNKAINEMALVSARQLSIDEAVRYSGTRNDPSRMAQNFAGVSGTNDARNDIVIRGNSPSGVLWRMDGIDIPNPNHFNTLGSTGGPVTMLNTNTLKNSDFMTSAFPAQYGNALAGVFDLRMRNGNSDKNEYLGEMGFNGFEFAAEGALNKKNKSSFLVDYRYSMVATIQALGLSVGTGSSTPYYQDLNFKFHINTKKAGTFDIFGLGGESHIDMPPDTTNNLYTQGDGIVRHANDKSLTGVIGMSNTCFYNSNTSGKIVAAISSAKAQYYSNRIITGKPEKKDYDYDNLQNKISLGYTFNKKVTAKNQITAGILGDMYLLNLQERYIYKGDSVISTAININSNSTLVKGFVNFSHRFTNQLSSNLGVYSQWYSLNNAMSVEPRWNLKYQLQPNQSLSFGAGMHSQMQPLEIYFYQTPNALGQMEMTNKNLDFVKSVHLVAGYDISINSHLRFKTEVYEQFINNAAVETMPTSFSMLNAGANFGFPEKGNLLNNGKGHNYGIELTLEKFLHQGFYYLITGSAFQSEYKGSDNVWRSTAFNSNYVLNVLGGKEFKINQQSSFSIDTKFAVAGGQRYTPFNIDSSKAVGYIVYKDDQAYSLQNNTYFRWDLKFSYTQNRKKSTQKWYIDFQNVTNQNNIFSRQLNPASGKVTVVNQIGFFPNVNYQITF